MNNSSRLEDLMLRYALRRRDIARLLGKPLNSAGGYSNSTVDRWLSGANKMPGHVLELLELKLSGQPQNPDHWQRLIRQPVPYADQRELELDLAPILEQVAHGEIPRTGRAFKDATLQRAGYWLELIAQLGGPRFKPHRTRLLLEANRLQKRLDPDAHAVPLRMGEQEKTENQDDLARKWHLSLGADIQRFRQLALTGHV
jgi:hypothetical protein